MAGAAAVALLALTAGAMVCDEQCQPWLWAQPRSGDASAPCSRGDRMDHRFVLGDIAAASVGDSPTGEVGYRTYFFCPEVDKFSSFALSGATAYAETTNNGSLYLAVYGAGKSSEVRVPDETQESHTLVYTKDSRCDRYGGYAMANFLLYNITLKDGNYRYKNGDPIGNGFVNSCESDGETCLFDSKSFCIGDKAQNKWNCAECVTSSSAEPRVLATFYGTDSGGKPLLSGSSNPLNFRQFALGNVYEDVKGDLVDQAKDLQSEVGL
eukprot:TRINITY_DN26424_c0_g1_i1.p1 TRINITY_DN26424_c0_g1~~TRINITY_DN26424_c0_g1_i1.p1  ORF type:complete len:285 (+),score=84.40 TRINITY_DN26424_c0_g1_i1:56-856(+)